MLINGMDSIYQEFDVWHNNNKVQANYDPMWFFRERSIEPFDFIQFHIFLSNYDLWVRSKILWDWRQRDSRRIDDLEGPDPE